MRVKLGQAVKMFFSSSSLEMVYFEAIANSLDANADRIDIKINVDALNKSESLKITISDNGEGFTDERYKKFTNLFDVDESSHKGLGRLVYLCYFEDVLIKSVFDKDKERKFTFNQEFDEKEFEILDTNIKETGSVFYLQNYIMQKIAKAEYVFPSEIKKRILEEFYPRLFQYKIQGRKIIINIESTIDNKTQQATLSNDEIPPLNFIELDSSVNLIDKLQLYYSIEECDPIETNLISAISVDNRTFKVDIIANENVPLGYKMVFLLFSDYFTGKVDAARQNLTISKQELKEIQNILRQKVTSLIEERIPKIKQTNKEIKENLINKFPHLTGYFETENIGYLKRNEILKTAQDNFFKDQKELLEANHLSPEQFEKSLEVSSRALTEYILFRQLIIKKLKESTKEDAEAELHKLIATKGKEGKFLKENLSNDIYKNNSWILDDKYMTYDITLSDREMSELLEYVVEGEVEKDTDRPDFAFIFSNHPNTEKPFDVVIVELKKRGVGLYDNTKTITQLESRARKLMKYYNNKVQRVWYYGIIEFNKDVELALSGEFKELYSSGKMYYKEAQVAYQLEPLKKVPIGIFIWDIDAVIEDANSRNNAFLNLIKSKFKED